LGDLGFDGLGEDVVVESWFHVGLVGVFLGGRGDERGYASLACFGWGRGGGGSMREIYDLCVFAPLRLCVVFFPKQPDLSGRSTTGLVGAMALKAEVRKHSGE